MLEEDKFTSQDLRNQLYSSLRQTGAVDSLKSQLRNRLVQELKRLGIKDDQDNSTSDRASTVFLSAANSLVADHLKKSQYDYSYSVFLPECGLSERKMFSTLDLLQLLKVSKNSLLYKNLSNNGSSSLNKGFLWQFLSEVAHLHGSPSYDTAVQTDRIGLPPVSSIEEKLKSVDEYYTNSDQSSHLVSIEERMMMYRKAVDQQAQGEVRMQVERIKSAELARIRSEEKEKFLDKLNAAKSEMERDYRVKYNILTERERNSMDQLQRQQRDAERESYMQRQNMLSEIETLRQRETDLRRQQETFERDRKMAEELTNKKDESIRRREEFIRRAESEYDHKLQVEIARYKAEAQAGYAERYRDLEFREMKAKEDNKRLEGELQVIQGVRDELRKAKFQVQKMEDEISSTKKDLQAAQQEAERLGSRAKQAGDYESLKDENSRLKQELSHTRSQLTQMSRSLDIDRRRHEELIHEMEERQNSRTNPEVLYLQREIERLRSQLKQEKTFSDQLRSQMNNQSFEERGRARNLLSNFQTQTYQQEEMIQEIDNLRQQLSSAQNVLKGQVFHHHTPSSPTSPDLQFMREAHTVSDDVTLYSQTEDYSYSGLLSDSKNRLKRLEQEAENLEENYRNFQHRMTTVEAVLPQLPHHTPPPKKPKPYTPDPKFNSPGTPFRVNVDRPQRVDIPQTYSQTQTYKQTYSTHASAFSGADRPSYPRSDSDVDIAREPSDPPVPLTDVPDTGPASASEVSEINKNTEASALGSIADEPSATKQDYRLDSEVHMPSEVHYSEPEVVPTSFQPAPVSLDSAWQRRSSEDSHTDKNADKVPDSSSPRQEPRREEPAKQEPEIDPVMQKYMDMIKQKRDAPETTPKEIIDSEKDISESLDKSKSQDEASDGIFDDW